MISLYPVSQIKGTGFGSLIAACFQNWLFSLWADSATAGGVQLEVTREMVTRLFCIIFRHNLLYTREGTSVIQQTEASLRLFAERGVLDYASVMRILFMALLRSLEPGTRCVPASHICRDGIDVVA